MRSVVIVVVCLVVGACSKDNAGTSAKQDNTGVAPGAPTAAGGSATPPAAAEVTVPAGSDSLAAGSGGAAVEQPTAGSAEADKPLAVGDHVQAQWTNGKWYPGKIVAIQDNGTFDVNFNDGDKSRGLPAAKVRHRPAAAPPPAASNEPLKVGDRVQAQWTNGKWYPGKIVAIQDNGTYDVNYNDGDKSKGLPAAKVRRPAAATSSGRAGGTASSNNAPCSGPGMVRRCGGKCVNIQTDDNNCGGCGNVCRSGYHCDGHMFCRDAAGNL